MLPLSLGAPCQSEVSDMGTSPTILQVLNSTTNPGNPLAAIQYLGCPLLHRGLPKHYLAAYNWRGFVVDLIITTFLMMISCHLPHSDTEHSICMIY